MYVCVCVCVCSVNYCFIEGSVSLVTRYRVTRTRKWAFICPLGRRVLFTLSLCSDRLWGLLNLLFMATAGFLWGINSSANAADHFLSSSAECTEMLGLHLCFLRHYYWRGVKLVKQRSRFTYVVIRTYRVSFAGRRVQNFLFWCSCDRASLIWSDVWDQLDATIIIY